MFVLSQSKSYLWPVVLELPVSGGKFEKHTFDAEFKRISQSRLKEILDGISSTEIGTDAILAREVLVGWKGVKDEGGEELPFSEDARDRLLDVQLVAAAVVTAFFKSIDRAKAKN